MDVCRVRAFGFKSERERARGGCLRRCAGTRAGVEFVSQILQTVPRIHQPTSSAVVRAPGNPPGEHRAANTRGGVKKMLWKRLLTTLVVTLLFAPALPALA